MIPSRYFIVLSIIVFSSSGCIIPYSAYPKIDYIPSARLESEGNVFAFRVVTTTTHHNPLGSNWPSEPSHEDRLAVINATHTDELPAQTKSSITYGIIMIGIALNWSHSESQTMSMRLYRPGYESVELKSWQNTNRIGWKSATDIGSQETALDELFRKNRLAKGSSDAEHRESLLFGAREYERLAGANPDANVTDRLKIKASALRKRADE